MISSGSMLDVAKQLKDKKQTTLSSALLFGLFTDGLEKFDEFYEKNTSINNHNKTNYKNPDIPHPSLIILEADMSKYHEKCGYLKP